MALFDSYAESAHILSKQEEKMAITKLLEAHLSQKLELATIGTAGKGKANVQKKLTLKRRTNTKINVTLPGRGLEYWSRMSANGIKLGRLDIDISRVCPHALRPNSPASNPLSKFPFFLFSKEIHLKIPQN
jgi:hypothetical protein